jgi:hypothetical protein
LAKVPLLLLALIVLVGGLIWLALDRAIQSVVAPALARNSPNSVGIVSPLTGSRMVKPE